ncbi:GNAT family N-acetyltransferase [Streptomyces yaizuensis]|uniref:GNAT family N-acetyltransferase n=1 Tax=Streptomyces yaizuensis TaxID=2989713 RepID=A0ABQ5NRB6_9ACTN|nr:GNAT family N-acetyltransferase [Streptomyces sp. YSPA8]GLF92924.1 GNAT family N-acetyltransferase [Streptomyces sp. YSPA8]
MIDYGFMDRAGRPVTLHEVDDGNWRAVADVAPRDDQRRFVPPSAARYLLLSLREGVWNSLAVRAGDTVAGHVMWARDDEDGSYWIGGMLIDAAEQGKGLGRAAVRTLMASLAERADCAELRLSYEPDNAAAGHLYTSLGFRATTAVEGEEIVAVLAAREATAPRAV